MTVAMNLAMLVTIKISYQNLINDFIVHVAQLRFHLNNMKTNDQLSQFIVINLSRSQSRVMEFQSEKKFQLDCVSAS